MDIARAFKNAFSCIAPAAWIRFPSKGGNRQKTMDALPPRHRNITLKRLLLDAWQWVRAQTFVVGCLGRQFAPSREYVEIDITYRCNLRCFNCNRSCTQAPSQLEIPVAAIARFIEQSLDRGIRWKRIRLLGGEPTLHSRIFEIVDLLSDYQANHNPQMRLVLGTNFYGRRVRRVISRMPGNVIIKSTLKTSRENLFRPFNAAPCDSVVHRMADYAGGCRIIAECGLGLTPSGYYMCAVAGGIDRVFQYHMGRRTLPAADDDLTDQMAAFCRLCGHFGFQWPTRTPRMTATWRHAYTHMAQAGSTYSHPGQRGWKHSGGNNENTARPRPETRENGQRHLPPFDDAQGPAARFFDTYARRHPCR